MVLLTPLELKLVNYLRHNKSLRLIENSIFEPIFCEKNQKQDSQEILKKFDNRKHWWTFVTRNLWHSFATHTFIHRYLPHHFIYTVLPNHKLCHIFTKLIMTPVREWQDCVCWRERKIRTTALWQKSLKSPIWFVWRNARKILKRCRNCSQGKYSNFSFPL